jgi:hypothetical protein
VRQVVTRLVGAACPVFYWALAEALVGGSAPRFLDDEDDASDTCEDEEDGKGNEGDDSDGEFISCVTKVPKSAREQAGTNNGGGGGSNDSRTQARQTPARLRNHPRRTPRSRLAEGLAKGFQPLALRQLGPWAVAWALGFNVVGAFLHANGLPWT